VDPARNAVIVGEAADLLAHSVSASAPRWVAAPPAPGAAVSVQLRAHGEPLPATVTHLDAGTLTLALDAPARAPAPGQAVVLYDGDRVLGGGTAERSPAPVVESR